MLTYRSKPLQTRKTSEKITTALASISQRELAGWVERISVPRHFTNEPEENERIALWIAAQLRSWGYEVQMQGRWRNVMAVPRDASSLLTLVGAHYDSVHNCPGADDNGSAVAAMLGCAKACATAGSKNVAFVSFNREEDGLIGSRDFVKWLDSAGQIRVKEAHILEMVGYASDKPGSQHVPKGLPVRVSDKGNFLGVLANRSSHQMLKPILKCAGNQVPDLPVVALRVTLGLEKYFPVLLRSDHAPFWERGIPATMWTDTSEFRNPHYHQLSDKPMTLNYSFLRMVTQLLVATVLEGAS